MKLERLFPYSFKDPSLLADACAIHSVAGQRLEWLGDRVLGQCVALLLYQNFPLLDEAKLSRALSRLVHNERLHDFGMLLDLPELHGPRQSRKAVGDVVEALYGAVMLDGGFAAALECARRMYGDMIEGPDCVRWQRDAKTLLKEACEREHKPLPRFTATERDGCFAVTCQALGIDGQGSGSTKAMAEQQAATVIVTALELTEAQAGA